MDFNFSFVYSTLVGAVVGGAVVWGVLKAMSEAKLRLLRRMARDAKAIAAQGPDGVEAAKRAAEEKALADAVKESVAKW